MRLKSSDRLRWEVIAPFAAILVEDENFTSFQEDEKIQEGVRQVIERHLELNKTSRARKAWIALQWLKSRKSFVQTTTMGKAFLNKPQLKRCDWHHPLCLGNALNTRSVRLKVKEQTDRMTTIRYSNCHIELLVAKVALWRLRSIRALNYQMINGSRFAAAWCCCQLRKPKALSGNPHGWMANACAPARKQSAYATNYLTLLDRITQISDEARRNVKGLPESEKYNLLMAWNHPTAGD